MKRNKSIAQLYAMSYKMLENVPEWFLQTFGEVESNFNMLVWGNSANGKTNLLMQVLQVLEKQGKVYYLPLEEGHTKSMQDKLQQYFKKGDKIQLADPAITFDELVSVLKRKKSAKFIVIDSLQYFRFTFEQYQELKQLFPYKSFIFISHANGKGPAGKLADLIRYDVPIKVHVEGFIAFPKSRYGGNKPHVIWEAGARDYWDRQYYKKSKTVKSKKTSQPNQ